MPPPAAVGREHPGAGPGYAAGRIPAGEQPVRQVGRQQAVLSMLHLAAMRNEILRRRVRAMWLMQAHAAQGA